MNDEYDDADATDEWGFEPAVSATGADPDAPAKQRRRQRPRVPGFASFRGAPRKLTAAFVLFAALTGTGAAYAALATSSGAAESSADQIEQGRQLFSVSCITCHGQNLEGVNDRGPSLIGTGAAATYFQVITGRMPANGQGAIEPRKTQKYTEEQVRALAAYVQAMGGGANLPDGELRSGDSTLGVGGELFRVNCASCHGTTGKGAPLSAGKTAPSLNDASDLVLWTAMLSGPESMPVFGNNQLTLDEKRSIVAYIQTLKASSDPGGSGIDRIGPVSEAIVIWVAGVGALMIAILWIGAKTQ